MAEISPQQPRDYLGRGWLFPLQVNIQGGVQLNSDVPNVEDCIRLILGTKLGERVYRPEFGSRLSELVFAPMNTQTLLLIRLYVEEALEQWEPRIVIDGIYTEPDPTQGRVDIMIQYHPKDAYDSQSMVYPFYLLPPN